MAHLEDLESVEVVKTDAEAKKKIYYVIYYIVNNDIYIYILTESSFNGRRRRTYERIFLYRSAVGKFTALETLRKGLCCILFCA